MKFTNKLAKAIDVARRDNGVKAIAVLDDVKKDTVIEFENGSCVKILKSTPYARSRIKGYRLDDDELKELLKPFCREVEYMSADKQLLYASSKDKGVNMQTKIWFKSNGQFTKQNEGIPIVVDNHPIGAVTEVTDEIVEGYINNRYIGLEYSKINGETQLSAICFGHPVFEVEDKQ